MGMMREDIQEFAVIDLASQASAVAAHVRGWTKDQILAWLSESGTVTPLPEVCGNETYLFGSGIGAEVAFFLNQDQFTFIGDNTTWRPK
jgi:hypothetical protein